MLSAVIRSELSCPAVPLARQQVDQRFVQLGPLVLESNPLKNQRLQQIGDQPVSRMFSRIAPCIGLYHHPKLFIAMDGQRVVSTGPNNCKQLKGSLGVIPEGFHRN